MTRVEAPSRLHFGLLHVPANEQPEIVHGLPVRQFGGIGLMIDKPRIILTAQRGDCWQAAGPSAQRALAFAQRFMATIPPEMQRPFQMVIEECPAEHTGLGVGTALGLAVAKALATELDLPSWSVQELARRVGRGERSAIGIHGFDQGGFIVEGGKLPGEQISPLIGRYPFPEHWQILLVQPNVEARWHGAKERKAFTHLHHSPTAELCRLVLTGILPGLQTKDLQVFGESLHEYNAKAGEAFRGIQGGNYAHSVIAEIIAELRAMGVSGVGQSSWGPTIFAVVEGKDQSKRIVEEFKKRCVNIQTSQGSPGSVTM
jgi:beta-RFAP synthase